MSNGPNSTPREKVEKSGFFPVGSRDGGSDIILKFFEIGVLFLETIDRHRGLLDNAGKRLNHLGVEVSSGLIHEMLQGLGQARGGKFQSS